MEKKFKHGLVLGKFMPPHNGHLYLIKTAASQCEKLFVIIGSLKNEPINGTLRYNWLKFIFEDDKNIEIIHCTDENPQKPQECESLDVFYNEYWVPSVYNRVEKLDVVFTSEAYGDEFAQYLGIEHVLVDIDRKEYTISGTQIRNNPIENWNYIPDEVKGYFMKRIVVVGPESTGKSTLVYNLAYEYGTSYVPEYGREYVEKIKSSSELVSDDFYEIAKKHEDIMLEKHLRHARPWVFIDTDALTTKIFGEMYINDYNDDRLDEIIKYQWFDLTLLMDFDVPWVDDGTRDFPNNRKDHFEKIKSELDKLGRKYVVINGTHEERFEKAKLEIEKFG